MSKRIIYGKEITIKADSLFFNAPNMDFEGRITLPSEINQPNLEGLTLSELDPNQGTQAYVNVSLNSTGARVTTGGAILHIYKLGAIVFLVIKPTQILNGLQNPTPCDASTFLQFTNAIPDGYRPSQTERRVTWINNNNVFTATNMSIDNVGTIQIWNTLTNLNFTQGVNFSMGSIDVQYVIA